ncbi:MAG: phenylalanine--tRNA ligase subunit beta, partial [Nitrosopumilus sp. B06]
MPVVELSYGRLQKMTGRPKKEIAYMLPYLGLDIESEDGDAVRIEYSPNRPDYSTDYGVALSLQGMLGVKTGMAKLRIKKSTRFIRAKPAVSKVRPYVTGIAAVGGRINDAMIKQLMSMQEDLHMGLGRNRVKASVGIHDMDRIAFPITYGSATRSHRFVPLGSNEEMSVSDILSKTTVGQEYGYILGNGPRMPLLLDAADNTVSLPPVINAASTTVTTKTKNLFVEVTGLSKGVIENVLAVICVVLQSAGFSLESVGVSGVRNATPDLGPKKMAVTAELVNQMLGLHLSSQQIVSCLKKSRLDASVSKSSIECVIPPYRFDIFGPMDLVEEVALGYGIDNLEPALSPSQTIGSKDPGSVLLGAVSSVMAGLGYMEALNSSLSSAKILYENMGRDSSAMVSVLDSKSQEHTVLRDSILPGLLDCLSRNIHEPYPQRLFETGIVFGRNNTISESVHLCSVTSHDGATYTEIKSALQGAVSGVFGSTCATRTTSHHSMTAGRCAEIIIDGKSCGVIGEVSREVLENFKLREPVSAFEMQIDTDA